MPVLMLNNLMVNKKQTNKQTKEELQQRATTQPIRRKLKTSKYEKTESVLLKQFRQKWALHTQIRGPMLRQ
jgi:hypothetical protein